MLLTLATNSTALQMCDKRPDNMALLDVPSLAIKKFSLRGLNLYASSLAGWSLSDLDRLRDRADKAACPCLVLIEDTPLEFGASQKSRRSAAVERVQRLCAASNRLGCNSIGVLCKGADTDEVFEQTAATIRDAMSAVERLELNLLIMPNEGLTSASDRLTELIKRIGGFRIGSLPTFAHAARSGDPVPELRKLAPYAGAIHASINGFTKSGKHDKYDLASCVSAIRSVGFTNTLAIEYLGNDDPVPIIEQAREALQSAIDAE